MKKLMLKLGKSGLLVLLLAMLIAISTLSSPAAHAADSTWSGKTTDWTNVRSGTTTSSALIKTLAPNTSITVYATVQGQVVWGGISAWYRISPLNSAAQFVYGGLVTRVNTNPPPTTLTGYTTDYANVRTGTNTSSAIVATYAPGTKVTIYEKVNGAVLWSGISTWYRVSPDRNKPQFIYAGLVSLSQPGTNPPGVTKTITISLSQQWLRAYENGREVMNTAITSGQPQLPTPTGTYTIFRKLSPTTFYSPWPQGSPYWYAPTHINYALEFKEGGYFIHDATWRSVFGPGTNVPHQDPQFGWITGSHGCVNVPLGKMQWLYNWAPNGTKVQINW